MPEPEIPSLPTSRTSLESAGEPRSAPVILVVDDDLFNVDLLLFELEDGGYLAEGLTSAREALLRLRREPAVDLILLDVMMPGMDGLELTQLLKGDADTRGIPVILLTAKGELGDKAQGFSAGADDYVVKPFDAEEVLARVEVQLRIRRLQSELERLGTARARLAMIGAAAHQLSQPLSGATGFLQLLQVLTLRGGNPGQEQERLLQVDQCLERAMTLARQLSELHQFRTEDYACGAEIVDLEASIRPAWQDREEAEPRIWVVDPVSESAPSWLSGLRTEGWQVLRITDPRQVSELPEPWLMVLNQVPMGELERWLTLARTGSGPAGAVPPFSLLVARAATGGFRGAALRAGVDDILPHPPHSEELLMRIRARLVLYRLQRDQLKLNSLIQARIVGERAFASFHPLLDACRLQVAELIAGERGPERCRSLDQLARRLESLTGTIRQLQARQLPEPPAGTPA